jgi:DNA ligase D-like protein (predicted 3'-phosphoesterase)
MDGVLKSWAVPKGPPVETGVKRLAVEVEDHPLDYMRFEGIIPEGDYGAGKVEIWDRGEYILKERTPRKISISLKGGRLSGNYKLIFMKTERGRAQWLLFKRQVNEFFC